MSCCASATSSGSQEFDRIRNLIKSSSSEQAKSSRADARQEWNEVTLDHGVKYTGQWWRTQDADTGQWSYGTRDGWGVAVWPDNSRYEGQWKEDARDGYGMFTHADGVYEGEWVADQAHGEGKERIKHGPLYRWTDDLEHGLVVDMDADLTDGQRNGFVVDMDADFSMFEGQYRLGKKSGTGKLSWGEGHSYVGDFANDVIQGDGVYKWNDGRMYKGQWVADEMHGSGAFIYADGRVYVGSYRNSRKEGRGVLTWPDGREFAGEWSADECRGLEAAAEAEFAKRCPEDEWAAYIGALADDAKQRQEEQDKQAQEQRAAGEQATPKKDVQTSATQVQSPNSQVQTPNSQVQTPDKQVALRTPSPLKHPTYNSTNDAEWAHYMVSRRNSQQATVNAWCRKKGFAHMHMKKSSSRGGSSFPLHVAVADKNAEMVALMVLLDVNQTATNSKGQTAKDLALSMSPPRSLLSPRLHDNKKGSMDAIIASLSAADVPPTGVAQPAMQPAKGLKYLNAVEVERELT